MKTLVIVLSETRAHELTFDSFKTNLIDPLGADLCVCIGVRPDYDYENPFYKLAKYRFLYNEPEDYGPAFDCAYDAIRASMGTDPEIHWREFLKIPYQYMGGVRDPHYEHPGSAGILIFFRWFLLQKLLEYDLISQYDRFVITRSDYIYQLPHAPLELLDVANIWIPAEAAHYGGFTDRHVVLSPGNIIPYLNILNNMVLRSKEYFDKMKSIGSDWNLEKLIKFHLGENGVLESVREFPYVMYTVRPVNGVSRWAWGYFSEEHGYFIKYQPEYTKALHYKTEFEKSGQSLHEFYETQIHAINIKPDNENSANSESEN